MEHIDEAEMQTTAYKIFHRHFEILLANEFIYSSDHLKRVYGLYSGDSVNDRKFLKDRTVVRKTPAQIVVLFDMGADPKWVSFKDMATTYQLLKTHLNDWAEQIKDPLSGVTSPPVNDLFLMETYINEIGQFAQAEINRQTRENYKTGVAQSDSWLDRIAGDFGGGLSDGFLGLSDTGHQPQMKLESNFNSTISEAFATSPFAQRKR